MTLKNSVVIFLASDTYEASLTSPASEISMTSKTLFSSKKFLILMILSPVVPKQPILVLFCGLDNPKSKILLIFDNPSFRGCRGLPILLFWLFIHKTQMSRPLECAAVFFQIIVGHLGLQSVTYRVDTPCNCFDPWKSMHKSAVKWYKMLFKLLRLSK